MIAPCTEAELGMSRFGGPGARVAASVHHHYPRRCCRRFQIGSAAGFGALHAELNVS